MPGNSCDEYRLGDGSYAYGRSRTDPSRRLPAHEYSGRVRRLDAGQWLVRIEGALPAYISVEQYERNLARLAANLDSRCGN